MFDETFEDPFMAGYRDAGADEECPFTVGTRAWKAYQRGAEMAIDDRAATLNIPDPDDVDLGTDQLDLRPDDYEEFDRPLDLQPDIGAEDDWDAPLSLVPDRD